MEDQAEKMEALKKAYAEIILNTAKEAAARTMVSESKALRFHHDLRNTKDEALQMLLRFKHMIDTKTNEAEMTSSSQQKRIQELDSQLNETEEVIVDLRAKLRHAHERLEEVKNSQTLQSNEPSENKHMDNSETTPLKKKLDMTEHFKSSSEAKENTFFIGNPKLSSTINGSKEPELYRNGYTHRIRAIERNLLDEKNISDKILTENSEQSSCTLRRSIRKRKVRCWDEISSLFKTRPAKKYSDNDNVKFNEHEHKLKSLAEMNHTILPISPSINSFEETKYGENEKHEVVEKESGGVSSSNSISEDKVVGTDFKLSACGSDKKRLLKYTFSRKRKKDSLFKSDNEKVNLKEDPNSDSQNMVEIACQLISLSGKHSL
ncbi:hypothetical protein L2E82_33402 [Cichorium intybus]|uniref:Uncharacterized protein n=1 Tax=Cichorium intybus TaxID=13427 RepID=A0ACB9BK23_CICIN|nr:hypothetical protein L2E82_33402 [Cichorium intybus]